MCILYLKLKLIIINSSYLQRLFNRFKYTNLQIFYRDTLWQKSELKWIFEQKIVLYRIILRVSCICLICLLRHVGENFRTTMVNSFQHKILICISLTIWKYLNNDNLHNLSIEFDIHFLNQNLVFSLKNLRLVWSRKIVYETSYKRLRCTNPDFSALKSPSSSKLRN